ncbi:hypothetical protein ACET3Z_026280 [Daucus carota]
MSEAILIDVASGLISRLVSLAADEVIRAWNVHEDLEELCGKLEFINDLLLDASTKKLTMTTVQRFFNKLEDVAHVANVFMNELEYEVTRQKVENHQRKRDFFVPSKNTMLHRFKMAHKIRSILDSFKEILKWGNDLGLQPVAYLNTTVQPSGSNNTSPFQDKALIVGRDNDISYLVQMVCKNHEENLRLIAVIGMGDVSKHNSATMNDSGVLSHNSKATYVRLDEGYSGTKPANMRRNFEGVQMLYVGARILGNVLPYLKHLTALVVNNDEVTYLLPSSLHKMKYLKHLDISCFHVIDSERCEEFPPLGHLPKLRKIKISSMENVKVIGSDIWGGVGSSGTEFSESGAPETVTTMYPSLTELILQDLPKLEEWLEPVVSSGSEDQRALLVFPKIEILVILNCPNLRRIPRNCFTFLKELVISDLDSSNMILESVSRTVSSLRYLRLVRISDGKEESSSPPPPNLDSISNKLLTNNSLSLRSLDIHQCEALTCMTLGVALQQLEVCYCPQLATISVAKDSVGLKYLRIASCPSLSEWVFVQSMSSTLVQLVLGPFLAELEEFPWPFSSSAAAAVIPFPNLIELNLYGWQNVKSILPSGKIGDGLSSTFPALTELIIQDFKGVKALPDSLAKLPCLRDLRIFSCGNLRSLPTFDESSSLQNLEISGCPVLQERCRKEGGAEWFKIQHIPHIEW